MSQLQNQHTQQSPRQQREKLARYQTALSQEWAALNGALSELRHYETRVAKLQSPVLQQQTRRKLKDAVTKHQHYLYYLKSKVKEISKQ